MQICCGYKHGRYDWYFCGVLCWFKHILFRRKGLGSAYNATMPSPEILCLCGNVNVHASSLIWLISLVPHIYVQFQVLQEPQESRYSRFSCILNGAAIRMLFCHLLMIAAHLILTS